jgi:hypothetical protein
MEGSNSFEKYDKEAFEIVLRELLKEQQIANKIIMDQDAAIADLIAKVNGLNQRLESFKVIAPPVSTKSFEEVLKKVITEKQLSNVSEPKVVTRKFQILLFPEQDAKLFYKIVFGRWLIWLTVMLVVTNIYRFSLHWSDNQKEIAIRNLEKEQIKKAWNYLYLQEGKAVKRLMDSAYNKSLQLK